MTVNVNNLSFVKRTHRIPLHFLLKPSLCLYSFMFLPPSTTIIPHSSKYFICFFNCVAVKMMYLSLSKPHIRSRFSVYTTPSEWCGTPASTPALGADSPDLEAPLSLYFLSSLFSLILLWSLSGLACPLLYKACWPALQPYHSSSETQFHHTKSYHQHVLQETAALNWACVYIWRWWVFSSLQCCQGSKQWTRVTVCVIIIQNRGPLCDGSEAKLNGLRKANWLCITYIKWCLNFCPDQ